MEKDLDQTAAGWCQSVFLVEESPHDETGLACCFHVGLSSGKFNVRANNLPDKVHLCMLSDCRGGEAVLKCFVLMGKERAETWMYLGSQNTTNDCHYSLLPQSPQ